MTLIAVYSCNDGKNNQLKNNSEIENSNSIIDSNFDSIIKRTNHSQLNLEKHQIFIDTTGYSSLNKDLQNWAPTKINEIESNIGDFQLTILDPDIPKRWITIRKYNNEFFNYDRCDGDDPRIEIIGNALIINGIHEKSFYKINEIKKENSGWILISNSHLTLEFKIEKTQEKNIFIFQFNGLNRQNSYVTQFENLKDFDQFVNHCPTGKVDEFSKFQNPE